MGSQEDINSRMARRHGTNKEDNEEGEDDEAVDLTLLHQRPRVVEPSPQRLYTGVDDTRDSELQSFEASTDPRPRPPRRSREPEQRDPQNFARRERLPSSVLSSGTSRPVIGRRAQDLHQSESRQPPSLGPSVTVTEPTSAPDPWAESPAIVIQFCGFGFRDYAQCAAFAKRKLDLWRNGKSLPIIAKQFLRSGDEEAARRIASRYWMLTCSTNFWRDTEPARHRAHCRYLDELATDQKKREKFEDGVEVLYKKLVDQVQESKEQDLQRSTHNESDSQSDSDEPTDIIVADEQPEELEALERIPEGQSFQSPLRARRGSYTSKAQRKSFSNVSSDGGSEQLSTVPDDFDTESVAGGKGFQGASGPKTDVIARWAPVLQSRLRQEYRVHIGEKEIAAVFGPGCVVAILWHENLGGSIPQKYERMPRKLPEGGKLGPGYVTRGRNFEEYIFSHIRRFLIVIKRNGHSIGIPITTYGGKAVTAKKLVEKERLAHAIIYASGRQPENIQDEPQFVKDPICIKIEAPYEDLSPTSRVYYGKPTTLEHNQRAKFIGRVTAPSSVRNLVATFRNELFGPDN